MNGETLVECFMVGICRGLSTVAGKGGGGGVGRCSAIRNAAAQKVALQVVTPTFKSLRFSLVP